MTAPRPRPVRRTPEERRLRRARQAARAIQAGRRRDENWTRIGHHLRDVKQTTDFMGLDIPAHLAAAVWPAEETPS